MAISKIALDSPVAASNRVTTIDIAALLKEHGLLGVAALLCAVIAYLFKLLQDRQKENTASLERVLVALADQKTALNASTDASRQIGDAVDKLGDALNEQSVEFVKLATESRHSFANLSQGHAGIVAVLEKLRDIVAQGRP